MDMTLISKFAPTILSFSDSELVGAGAPSVFRRLLLAEEGELSVCYAPFEYINAGARVVIVGITPGKTQMLNAIRAARDELRTGSIEIQVLRAAKQTGAFSGEMRQDLVAMLDHVGLHERLGIASSAALFGSAAGLLQTASVLRNPVFRNGDNYRGTPKISGRALLQAQLLSYFAKDIKESANSVLLPLGDTPHDALVYLAQQGYIDDERILPALPHPSPANRERIHYFLGKKPKELLSSKTDAAKLDSVREELRRLLRELL